MKKHRGSTGDWLSALTIMGRILIFVPIIVGFIAWLLSLFGANPVSDESIFAGGTMLFLCGVATPVYVAVKRFRQGLRGEVETREDKKSGERK